MTMIGKTMLLSVLCAGAATAALAGLKVKAVNTGLGAFGAAMICEDGDIKVTLVKSGLLVLIK